MKKENSVISDNAVIARIHELTKIGLTTIYKVIKLGTVTDHSLKRKRTNQKLSKVDNATKHVIKRIVYGFYKDNMVPTLELIRDKLRDIPEYNYQCLETLRAVLLNCGFKYKNIISQYSNL